MKRKLHFTPGGLTFSLTFGSCLKKQEWEEVIEAGTKSHFANETMAPSKPCGDKGLLFSGKIKSFRNFHPSVLKAKYVSSGFQGGFPEEFLNEERLLKDKLFLMVDVIQWHTRKYTDSYFVILEQGN